jgi:short-subunit dehydrogenase
MQRRIADKVIIITGASSGIGRATALALGRERARLVLVARRAALLARLCEEIRSSGGSAEMLALDLRTTESVQTMVDTAFRQSGRIDVLINNAGVGYFGAVEHTADAALREVFALNFAAPLAASQLVIPIMRRQGQGHIINMSSVAGKRGLPLSGAYCASKFALNGITETLRLELMDSNIDVSLIHPAATSSEFHEHVLGGEGPQRSRPMGPVQPAEAVAGAVVRCIRKPRPEVYPNQLGRLLVWLNAVAPSLVDRIMIPYLRDRSAQAADSDRARRP